MTDEIGNRAHVALWNAINLVVAASGGNTNCTSVARQRAVVAVETALLELMSLQSVDTESGGTVLDSEDPSTWPPEGCRVLMRTQNGEWYFGWLSRLNEHDVYWHQDGPVRERKDRLWRSSGLTWWHLPKVRPAFLASL